MCSEGLSRGSFVKVAALCDFYEHPFTDRSDKCSVARGGVGFITPPAATRRAGVFWCAFCLEMITESSAELATTQSAAVLVLERFFCGGLPKHGKIDPEIVFSITFFAAQHSNTNGSVTGRCRP